MKFKKLVSAVSALTVAAGCIGSMGITASAEVILSEDFTNAIDSWEGLGTWKIGGGRQTSQSISTDAATEGNYLRITPNDNNRSMNIATLSDPIEGDMVISYDFFYTVWNSNPKKTLRDVISFANSDNNVLFGISASFDSTEFNLYTGGTLSDNTAGPTWGGDSNIDNGKTISGLTFNSEVWYSVKAVIQENKINVTITQKNNQANSGSMELDITGLKKDLKYSKFCIDAGSTNAHRALMGIDNISIQTLDATVPETVNATGVQDFSGTDGTKASVWEANITGTETMFNTITVKATSTEGDAKEASVKTTNISTGGAVSLFVIIENKAIADMSSVEVSTSYVE